MTSLLETLYDIVEDDNLKKAETIEKQAARIAELEAENTRLIAMHATLQDLYEYEEDINRRYAKHIGNISTALENSSAANANERRLSDMAWNDNQAALRELTEENRGLRQMLNMESK